MQEEAELSGEAAAAQLLAERDQVIVVDPDLVSGAEPRLERVGEAALHREIGRAVVEPELGTAG